jgi:hypothetical protein
MEAARLSEIPSEASGASAIRIALHARRAVRRSPRLIWELISGMTESRRGGTDRSDRSDRRTGGAAVAQSRKAT